MRPMPVWISSAISKRAVFAAERRGAGQEFVRGHVDALALDRLDDEGGNLARRQRLLQRGEIVERNRGAAGQQRLETAAEIGIVGQRQRAVGQSVERMGAIHDARPAGGAAGELDRGFDTFRAGIGKKDLVQIGHVFQQALGQHAGQASKRRAARDWAGRCRARSSRPGAAPDGSGQSQKRQNRSVDRGSARRRDRTDTGPGPSESRHRSRLSSGPGPAAHLSGAHAWNCAATAGPQTSRKRLDLNIASVTYFG